MGAWGRGTFENDDARDWVRQLERAPDLSVIEAALDGAVSAEYPEAPQCAEALAAVDVLAALQGTTVAAPQEVTAWVRGKPAPSAALIAKAKRAIDAVLANSELKDLWEESSEGAAWEAEVRAAKARLR